MRILGTALIALVLAVGASAQVHFASVVLSQPHPLPQFRDLQKMAEQVSGTHRFWYWEVDDTVRVPFETYNYLPNRMMVVDQGFSPVSLTWNFTGKHKLMPSLDLTVIQVKPGEPRIQTAKPDSEFGTFYSDHGMLWAKATQSLKAALHY